MKKAIQQSKYNQNESLIIGSTYLQYQLTIPALTELMLASFSMKHI